MKIMKYFSKTEIVLWTVCVMAIILSNCFFDSDNLLSLIASLVGVTSLIFNAKGNPAGQVLMIVFSLMYGVISYSVAYYGEMITYLGMTMPMSVLALVSWLKHPFKGKKAEVEVNTVGIKEQRFMWLLAAAVTLIFYFILKYFNTANLVASTLSVTTSFVAVYLTFRRSPYFALAYAANDVVLVILWILASFVNVRYVSVAVCFTAFLANDIYGYLSWQGIMARQRKAFDC